MRINKLKLNKGGDLLDIFSTKIETKNISMIHKLQNIRVLENWIFIARQLTLIKMRKKSIWSLKANKISLRIFQFARNRYRKFDAKSETQKYYQLEFLGFTHPQF